MIEHHLIYASPEHPPYKCPECDQGIHYDRGHAVVNHKLTCMRGRAIREYYWQAKLCTTRTHRACAQNTRLKGSV